jgi:hypothetical protein
MKRFMTAVTATTSNTSLHFVVTFASKIVVFSAGHWIIILFVAQFILVAEYICCMLMLNFYVDVCRSCRGRIKDVRSEEKRQNIRSINRSG